MDDVRQMLDDHERISFAERMHSTAGRMARRAANSKEISEASKPLYSRLDDPQKRKFRVVESRDNNDGKWLDEGKLGSMTRVPGCQKTGMKSTLSPVPALNLHACCSSNARYRSPIPLAHAPDVVASH